MTRAAVALLLSTGLLSASYLARLDIGPATRDAVIAEALPVYKDLGTCLILPLSEDQFASLNARGRHVEVLDTDLSPGDYFIVYKSNAGKCEVRGPNSEVRRSAFQTPGRLLWENERLWLVRMPEAQARKSKASGIPIVRLSPVPHPLPAPPAPPDLSRYTSDTTIAGLVSLVSQDSLARTIQDLQAFVTRYSYYSKCESAAFYLRQRLIDLGYAVRMDTYYLPDPRTRSFNVEATLSGFVKPESIVIACAHYDSYSSHGDSAPGANDDGTGTAAVVELARVLKQAGFRWSVKFLCFSGEEQWMLGSAHWVDSTAVLESLKIAGVYNLDMFGYTAYDTNMLTVSRNAASLSLAVLAESTNAWYGIGLQVINYLDEDCAGDNAPFWEHGYQAVFACEDSEWGIWNGSDPYYHTPYDTFGNLRMGQVRRTSQLALACLATLATPCDTEGVAESHKPQAPSPKPEATVIRGVLYVPGASSRKPQPASLLDITGREVLALQPGSNQVGGLAPGVYFIRTDAAAAASRVVKVR